VESTDIIIVGKYTVTLLEGNKYKEHDNTNETSAGFNKGKIGLSFNGFSGQTYIKSITTGIGKNNTSGEGGIIKFDFDTNRIKNPIRNLLKENGWQKKG
jgi:hypothetical protein